MSKLEELIQELCPDGVETFPLEECCNILDKKRKPVTKILAKRENIPIMELMEYRITFLIIFLMESLS